MVPLQYQSPIGAMRLSAGEIQSLHAFFHRLHLRSRIRHQHKRNKLTFADSCKDLRLLYERRFPLFEFGYRETVSRNILGLGLADSRRSWTCERGIHFRFCREVIEV